MERRLLFVVFSGLGVLYMAPLSTGQYFNDPTKFYKNMTFNYDVRHRGSLGVPDCVRQLMECWELVTAQVICSHWQYYETVCMLMKNRRCHDLVPFGHTGWPYDNFHMIEQMCLDNNYYTRRRAELGRH